MIVTSVIVHIVGIVHLFVNSVTPPPQILSTSLMCGRMFQSWGQVHVNNSQLRVHQKWHPIPYIVHCTT